MGHLKEIFSSKYNGNYNCSYKSLETLKSLKIKEQIEGEFNCLGNYLETLEGSPKTVKGNFYCQNNNLKSLKGSPKEIDGDFDCSGNKLSSLEYCTKIIKGDFYCLNNNPELINIKDQIIKYQIKATIYYTNDDDISFEEIKEEFEKYGNYLLKEKEKKLDKEKLKQNIKTNKIKINNQDYGLSL